MRVAARPAHAPVRGWTRPARAAAALVLSAASGFAGFAAHPPIGVWWLSLLVVPLLLAALVVRQVPADGPITRRWAGVLGGLAGAVTFLPMLRWLIRPAGYLGWLALSLTMVAWYALTAVVLRHHVRSARVVLAAPVLWTGMEIWRGSFPLSGFAWGTLDYAHAAGSWLLPLARLLGSSAISLVTVLLGALVFHAVRAAATRRGARTRMLAAAPALGAAAVVSVAPLASPAAPPHDGTTIDVLAVQGNDLVAFAGSSRDEDVAIARRMVAETRASVQRHGRPDLTVWPESAIDRDPFGGSGTYLRPYLLQGAALTGGQLLVGTNLDGPDPTTQFLNTAHLVDGDGRALDRYVKRRYVPFGEYVPFRPLLTALVPPLRQVPRDGVPGPGPHAVTTRSADVAVVICYETLYRSVVRDNLRAADAGLVVAVTNDATFGQGAESDQHVAQSRMRAVETGRWVLHAALSGGSALIDPDGRVVRRTGLFERATIRADVPLVTADTPFVVLGDVAADVLRWAAVALLAVGLVDRRRGTEGELAT
ncbi:MAG TPA: apolipoprotein N-acyltransferase [Nitriliruptorales bacterium]|nr:apolipoprotein N-acyltransferase [Nitriliruptorales bacterium]